MLNKTTKFIIVSVLLLFSTQAFCVIFIDVAEFNFPKQVEKGVRVCIFDTEEQKYLFIDYFPYPSSSVSRKPSDQLPETYYKNQIVINYNGNIKIYNTFVNPKDSESYIVRTNISGAKINDNGNIFYSKKINIIPASTIMEELNKFRSQKRKKKGEEEKIFKATFCYYKKELKQTEKYFSNLSSDKKENNDERGILGELATEYTMMGYGYIKKSSKYEKDHGIDGVFVGCSKDHELFLTEAKCWENSISPKKILKLELNEKILAKKIEKISKTHPETNKLIQDFIDNKPEKIFKFAHRIKPDGTCQCMVVSFDIKEYRSIISLSTAITGIWEITTSGVKEEYKSEKDYFQGVVKSLNISSDDKERMLAIYNQAITKDYKKEGEEEKTVSKDEENDDDYDEKKEEDGDVDCSSESSQASYENQGSLEKESINAKNEDGYYLDIKNITNCSSSTDYFYFEEQLAGILNYMKNNFDISIVQELEKLEKQIVDSMFLSSREKEMLINRINTIKKIFPEYARVNIPDIEKYFDQDVVDNHEKFKDAKGYIIEDYSQFPAEDFINNEQRSILIH